VGLVVRPAFGEHPRHLALAQPLDLPEQPLARFFDVLLAHRRRLTGERVRQHLLLLLRPMHLHDADRWRR